MEEREGILLQTEDLKKYFSVRDLQGKKVSLKAVDGISLTLKVGETLGLVGESGCGKSTFGKTILNLTPATAGKVYYKGRSIESADRKSWKELRRKLQIIHQDAYSSLNPRMTLGQSVRHPLDIYRIGTQKEREEKVRKLFRYVGLQEEHMDKYPHELSGGQRQRAVIARAVILDPELIVCDEAVSALDVSVRAQVLNLLRQMQMNRHMSYLFISHDLSVVRFLCDRVAVMYMGKLVEVGEKSQIYSAPAHPYTKALMSAIPQADIRIKREQVLLEGDVPSATTQYAGCRFASRCPLGDEGCMREEPNWKKLDGDHFVACHKIKGESISWQRIEHKAN